MKAFYTIFFVLLIGILSSHTARSGNVKNNLVDCEGSPDYLAGYNAGHLVGYNLGVAEGTKNGSAVCYNVGFNAGFQDGSADGYDIGYDDGYDDGSKTINNNKISIHLAVNVVNSDCYDLGFANGQSDGYKAGYNKVINSSYGDGYDVGYDDGFGDGWYNGYDDGFVDGGVKIYNPHYNPSDYPDKYPNNNLGCNLLGISSISEIQKENVSLNVYPNPSIYTVNLQLSNSVVIDEIFITNILGQIVYQKEENISLINIEDLAKGLYIVEAYSDGKKYASKFIKE
ncbi:Por secretion system C-terminal sorting domain-containing protein [Flavobacterium fluvii]|uniref:Por secretion system C-terminal sorting domain-containing protein n=1 Tax=Flavobacterium fluvii TaxID=468056 RepID=A0A1M5KDL0_9FLAO|nr:T9SS type A sorting domain-containing protein [Flavobacterium fluvii]SHG50847.1 Por secretion system C-terminal sorting domain-containing protein [Flavobacterium fluvii]